MVTGAHAKSMRNAARCAYCGIGLRHYFAAFMGGLWRCCWYLRQVIVCFVRFNRVTCFVPKSPCCAQFCSWLRITFRKFSNGTKNVASVCLKNTTFQALHWFWQCCLGTDTSFHHAVTNQWTWFGSLQSKRFRWQTCFALSHPNCNICIAHHKNAPKLKKIPFRQKKWAKCTELASLYANTHMLVLDLVSCKDFSGISLARNSITSLISCDGTPRTSVSLCLFVGTRKIVGFVSTINVLRYNWNVRKCECVYFKKTW